MGEACELVGSFKEADALLENIRGWVHEPGVDVPEFFEGKEIGCVLSVFKSESGAFVNWNGAGVGDGIRLMTAVEAECFVFHVRKDLA